MDRAIPSTTLRASRLPELRQATSYPPSNDQQASLPAINDCKNNLPSLVPAFDAGAFPGPPPLLKNPTWAERTTSTTQTAMPHVPQLRQTVSMPAYPSPANSNFGSPGFNGGYSVSRFSSQMPPPMATSNPMSVSDVMKSPYNGAKRRRLSPRTETFGKNSSLVGRVSPYGSLDIDDASRVQFSPLTPTFFPSYMNNPMTPSASSMPHFSQDAEDRRISVSSLLSEDPELDDYRQTAPTETTASEPEPYVSRRGSLHQRMISYSETETYGQDRGNPDLDVPRNNDTMAITGASPSEHSEFDSWLNNTDLYVPEFGFRLDKRETVFAKGGYYSSPVPIKIPRKLEPLPQTLSENPMNLLYFHHFLNHTARILVPHDCPENPFKTILPKSQ